MIVDDGGGRGVKNGQKSDDVINGQPHRYNLNLCNFLLNYFELICLKSKALGVKPTRLKKRL